MGQLVLSARIRGQATTQCDFTISIDGGGEIGPTSVVLDQSIFIVPDVSAKIDVQANSFEPSTLGTVAARLEIDQFGNVSATFLPNGWEPLVVLPSVLGNTIFLVVHFSPVRDATERARASLAQSGLDFPGAPPAPPPGDMTFRPAPVPLPPATYSPLPQEVSLNYIASPPIAGGKIKVETRTITPSGDLMILRLPGVATPQLVAVYWPASVPRGPGAPPAKFLIFFRPGMAQNAPQFFEDPRDRHDPMTNQIYPWGWDYQFFGLLRPLRYFGDPLLDDPFSKGFPYQIEASGRSVVLVMPLPRVAATPCDEITSFTDAVFLQEYLEEIQAFMFRGAGNTNFGPIGRLGMASFSSGHALMTCFLSKPANRNHPLYLDKLQEIYLFDPHDGVVAEVLGALTQATAWATVGSSATKIARLYTQMGPNLIAPLLAQLGVAPANPPFHSQTPDGRKSLTCMPREAWEALVQGMASSVPYANTGQVHQAIPALMVTDALRRSGF